GQPKTPAPLPNDVPTAAELAALDLINLYRIKTREAQYVIDGVFREYTGKNGEFFGGAPRYEWENASSKRVAGEISPLVLNPVLIKAARTLLASKATWTNKQPFPFAETFKAAGYTPDGNGLILIGSDMSSVRSAFTKAVTNVNAETILNKGEKNEKIIHTFVGRDALTATWREAGIAVDETGGKCSVVFVIGTGSAPRYLGGIAYVDANHNGTCDPGEAKPGVKVTAGEVTTTSGPTGAWWMTLKNTNEVDAVFTVDGLTGTVKVPSAPTNVVISWRVPNTTDMKNVDKLIADNEKGSKEKDEEKRRKALSIVLAGTRMSILDDEHQRKVDAFIQPIKEDYDELLRKALSVMGEEEQTYKKRITEFKLPWKGCFITWFKEIDNLYQLRLQVNGLSLAPASKRTATVPALTAALVKASATSSDPILQEQFDTLKVNLENLPPPPVEAPKPAKKP
ncbi:MAG: hypothetical protein AAB263_11750, partial [Planctomycetota bacterium]